MKKIPTYIRTAIFVIATFLSVQNAQAQIIFPDDVDDEAPAAPIDGFILAGLLAGAYFGLTKKKEE